MQNKKTLAQVFQNKPLHWGLRGDPYLWEEMNTMMGDLAYPCTEEDFLIMLEQTYQQLTGRSIEDQEPVLIERYNRGGMSGGQVYPRFWVETGFPLLLARYRETK